MAISLAILAGDINTGRLLTERSNPLHIPQELVELIIDTLSYDAPSLNACSLTCKAWLHRSQYRLHRHLRFSDVKHLVSDPHRYLEPATARYVYSLDLAALPTTTSPCHCGERVQAWDVIARLTQVRRLTIRNLEDAATITPFVPMVFPQVTELILGKAEFDSFAQFKSFFTSFTHLSRFQLDEFDIFPWLSESEEEDISEDEDDYLEFPLLQHLTLSGRTLYSAELIDLAFWLRSELPGPYSLRSLTFRTWYGGRFGTMKAYLAACRRSLEVLELPMGASEPNITRMNFARFGFKRLARLHSISFVAAENPWAIRQYTSDCVPLTLAQIDSKSMSHIRFDFSPARGTYLAALLDLHAVDHVLSQPPFANMRFADIICNRDQAHSRYTAERAIRKGLARTVQRGIVRLDFGDFLAPLIPVEAESSASRVNKNVLTDATFTAHSFCFPGV
ncbi:hypothetical protein BXZ70DRAFT_470314 [Cristinia sonorae]|uniref:F-box domain-containing protein n=1 Tax=Cristinia sonorae TaxID=1940300 RepID=A0A8K0UH57_9AGAR|nr:hypothetical protein BXZ70DRAFT_470314 [Cristinia sonorae]